MSSASFVYMRMPNFPGTVLALMLRLDQTHPEKSKQVKKHSVVLSFVLININGMGGP